MLWYSVSLGTLSSPPHQLDRCSCSHRHSVKLLNWRPAPPTANLWQGTYHKSSNHTNMNTYVYSIHTRQPLAHTDCPFCVSALEPECVSFALVKCFLRSFLWVHLSVLIKVLADHIEVASCKSASSGNDSRHVAEVKLVIMLQDCGDKYYTKFNSLLTQLGEI